MVNEIDSDRERDKKMEAVERFQEGDDILPILTPITASDCVEYPPVRYILDGLIEAETITLISGREKIGKTYVLMHMALCMAAELPWLEIQTMTDDKGGVLWLDFDMNRNTMIRRINQVTNGIEEAWNVRKPDLFKNFGMMDAQLFRDAGYTDKVQFFNESDAVQGLTEYIITNNVKVCFIDNLVQIEGDAQENSSNDIQKVFSGIKALRDLTKCAFILIHHTTKDGFRGRGSSDIFGETDLNLQLEPCTDPDQLLLKTDGARNSARQTIGMKKEMPWRIGEDGWTPMQDENGHFIQNFVLKRIETEGLIMSENRKEKKDAQIQANIDRIVTLFQKNGNVGLSKNGISNACNTDQRYSDVCKLQGGRSVELESIDEAERQGLIIKDGKFYKLPTS